VVGDILIWPAQVRVYILTCVRGHIAEDRSPVGYRLFYCFRPLLRCCEIVARVRAQSDEAIVVCESAEHPPSVDALPNSGEPKGPDLIDINQPLEININCPVWLLAQAYPHTLAEYEAGQDAVC
jgi:hypothetical protein